MIRAVLFDYGGTLVVPKRPWPEVISEITLEIHKTLTDEHGLRMDQQQFVELNDSVFQKYGLIEEKENRDVADIIKNEEIIDSLFPHRPEEWRQTVAKEIHDAFWSLSYPNWTLRNDARAALAELSRMGLKMAIVSNHHDTNLSRYLGLGHNLCLFTWLHNLIEVGG